MDVLLLKEGFPLLSFLIFFPLAGALVMLAIPSESFAKVWALIITTLTAIFSIPLLTGFDAGSVAYQFAELHS